MVKQYQHAPVTRYIKVDGKFHRMTVYSGETSDVIEWARLDRIKAQQEIDSIVNRVHRGDVDMSPKDHIGFSNVAEINIDAIWDAELQKTNGKYIPGDPEYISKRKESPKKSNDLRLLDMLLNSKP